MATNHEFYIARAEESALEAAAASLDNVRERALRSEAVWRGMANRALTIEHDRETTKRDREERIAAEKAARLAAVVPISRGWWRTQDSPDAPGTD